MNYLLAKLIHLVALIFWIGPPLGAYYLLFSAHLSRDRARILWAERATERVLAAEHVAFAVLVLSGAYLVWSSEGALLAMPWLQKKLMLFAGVLVFEVLDIGLAHVHFHRLLAREDAIGSPAWRRAERLRMRLAVAGGIVALVLIPGMMYFAVAKS